MKTEPDKEPTDPLPALTYDMLDGCDRSGEDSEAWLWDNHPRLVELLGRLVAVGNPHSKFSCSEFHELHDGVMDVMRQLYTGRK